MAKKNPNNPECRSVGARNFKRVLALNISYEMPISLQPLSLGGCRNFSQTKIFQSISLTGKTADKHTLSFSIHWATMVSSLFLPPCFCVAHSLVSFGRIGWMTHQRGLASLLEWHSNFLFSSPALFSGISLITTWHTIDILVCGLSRLY